jgi:two-component system, chemotaxis family, chemotaxis protein CheY
LARKILLADDSVTAQNMGRKILADAGYEVITVNNGSAALKRIAEIKPDVIVLDVYMPGYSGLEVCQRLKESNDTARIPILLTVGKLEPFKPEEARRVRAEGFIVKPFEASELLSVLTKLEDKIVPRADSSKPGRFARAIAAVEEGRYDKTVPIDEDSGWKSRISFPRKKKEKPVEAEDGDDPSIYNPVNRDLKTVVEHKPTQVLPPSSTPSQPPAQQEQANVDLGALVAHGLPKDVTPEEIAALAAAAAQVQGIMDGSKSETPVAAPAPSPQVEHEKSTAPENVSDAKAEAVAQSDHADPINSAPTLAEVPSPQAAQMTEAASVPSIEVKAEDAQESAVKQAVSQPAASVENLPDELPMTFAPEGLEKEEESAPETRTVEVAKEEIIASSVDALPVVASFAASDMAASSDNDSSPYSMTKAAETESVAIAVTAAAEPVVPSRWSAVAVALAPEETAISLEEEMRQAQESAPVAQLPVPAPVEAQFTEKRAEIGETEFAGDIAGNIPGEPEASSVGPNPLVSNAAELVSPEPPKPEPRKIEPAALEPAEEKPPAALLASPNIKEFETVALPGPAPAVAEATVDSPSLTSPIDAEVAPAVPSPAESIPEARQPETVAAPGALEAAPSITDSEPINIERPEPEKELVAQTDLVSEAIAQLAETDNSNKGQEPETARPNETPVNPQSHISQENVEPAFAATEGTSGGLSDMAKKESEMAATTAAAWASWRRIRETGDNKSTGSEKEPEATESRREEAAMAVAAGAEKAPEEASGEAELSPEIATIVDSVLADLRPKIVEEISRKLGKKK